MKYTVTQKELKKDQIIQKVYKTVDQQNHIRIKWDCLKADEYNLIIVVRTLNTSFDLTVIERAADIPKGTDIFVYSRRETERYAETRQPDKNYTYYVYPGKLASKGEIEIYHQKDGNNVITEESRTTFIDRYMKPKGKLYYRLLFPIPFGGWNKELVCVWSGNRSIQVAILYIIRCPEVQRSMQYASQIQAMRLLFP